MGRHLKLNKKLIADIVAVINDGGTNEDAAILNDIAEETFYEWLRLAEVKKRSIYAEFSEAVKKAKVARKLRRLERIEKAGERKEWQADAWYLERVHPDEFGKREKHENTGPNGGPQEFRITFGNDSQLPGTLSETEGVR
jgi:hypothetical protein